MTDTVTVSDRMRKLFDRYQTSLLAAHKLPDAHPDAGAKLVYCRLDRDAILREIGWLETVIEQNDKRIHVLQAENARLLTALEEKEKALETYRKAWKEDDETQQDMNRRIKELESSAVLQKEELEQLITKHGNAVLMRYYSTSKEWNGAREALQAVMDAVTALQSHTSGA